MRSLALLLLSMVTPTLTEAQALRGKVFALDGKPFSAVSVAVFGDTTARGFLASRRMTDGRFSFDTVPAGARYLKFYFSRAFLPYPLISIPQGAIGGDTIVLRLEDPATAKFRADSIRREEHLARVAIARARPREWVCTLGTAKAHERAHDAYEMFVATEYEGMRRFGNEYGIPRDQGSFERMFVRPLSAKECQRFAEGYDRRNGGLETDTIEVYRFGTARWLPWLGGYSEGGFADADGKVTVIFVVPD